MVISDIVIGKIRMAVKLTKKQGVRRFLSRVAREVGVSRATVKKYCRASPKRKAKKPSKRVADRCAALKKIALQRSSKGDRVFPTFGSADQIRQALYQQKKISVSTRTVQRNLKSSGLRSFARNVVPSRNRGECATKKAFLRRMKKKPLSYLRRIVFSDETWLSTQERTSKRMYALNRADVLPREKKTRWNYSAFQVFAACGVGWKSPLIVLPVSVEDDGEVKAYRLNADRYIRKCLSPIVERLVADRRILQQDGARSHMSRKTIAFLRRKRVEVLENWPPYAPELSPIETVWRVLHNRIGKRCPLTMAELKTCALQEWAAIPQAVIDRICTHFQLVG